MNYQTFWKKSQLWIYISADYMMIVRPNRIAVRCTFKGTTTLLVKIKHLRSIFVTTLANMNQC